MASRIGTNFFSIYIDISKYFCYSFDNTSNLVRRLRLDRTKRGFRGQYPLARLYGVCKNLEFGNYVSGRSEQKVGLLLVLIKLAVYPIGNLWLNLEDVF